MVKYSKTITVLRLGGTQWDFNTEISLDGLQSLLSVHTRIRILEFDYCSRIGDESINIVSSTILNHLVKFSIPRNFNNKCAKITDKSMKSLQCCKNLEYIGIGFNRKFADVAEHLSHFKKLKSLTLKDCTVIGSFDSFINTNIQVLNLSGDSWIRPDILQSVSQMPHLLIFHMGHYEHSDCDCKSMVP